MFSLDQEFDRFVFEFIEKLVQRGYMFRSDFFELDVNDFMNRVYAIQKQPQPGKDLLDLLIDSYKKDQMLRMLTDRERSNFEMQLGLMRSLQIYNFIDFGHYILPKQAALFLAEIKQGKLSQEEALDRKRHLETPMRKFIEMDPTDQEMKEKLRLVCNAFQEYSHLSDVKMAKSRSAKTMGDQESVEKELIGKVDKACLTEFRCDGVNDPDLELAKMYAKYSGLVIDLASLQAKESFTDTEKQYEFRKTKEDDTLIHEETVSILVSDLMIGIEQEHRFFQKTDSTRQQAYVIHHAVSFTNEENQVVRRWWETRYDEKDTLKERIQNIPHSDVSYTVPDDFALRGTLTPQKVHVFMKK